MTVSSLNVDAEIEHWFFETYFNHWVDVMRGERDEGFEFIHEYYSTPMFVTADEPDISMWLSTKNEVVWFIDLQAAVLKEAGYTHTVIPEKRVRVYSHNGGSIEVIWSRRAADETEIQRFAAHFQIIKLENVWKVVGIQVRNSTEEVDRGSIDLAWLS